MMSLSILAPLVVIGIAVIVLAVHWSGGSQPLRLCSGDEAIGHFRSEYPEIEIDEVVLCKDGTGAFMLLECGQIGLVQPFGHRHVVRLLGPRDLRAVRREGKDSLVIHSGALAWPGGTFALQDAKQLAGLVAALDRLTRPKNEIA
jgi:hypothetical protein